MPNKLLTGLLMIGATTAAFAQPDRVHDSRTEYSFGNQALALIMGHDGLLQQVASDGEAYQGNVREIGPLFRVLLLENVYGLDAPKRRELSLRPVAMGDGRITLAPEKEPLPRFTFRTIDKGSYFVLELLSMQNPDGEHALQLIMTRIPPLRERGIEWLPLDSVTKKTYRRHGHIRFFGVLQRSKKNPLGSIAMWASGREHDETLYKIWTTEDIPHPKVEGEWTIERARDWIAEYIRVVAQGNNNQMIIGPRTPEDLAPLVDIGAKFGMGKIYMHLNTWSGRYWPTDKDNLVVNPTIFPAGVQDMAAFAKDLQDNDLRLTYRTVSYALTPRHRDYLAKGHIDPRLASWWQGTVAAPANAAASEITVAQGDTHLTRYDPNRRWTDIFDMRCMQIGNELVLFSGQTSNGDGTWTLHNCKRGFGRTDPQSHQAGEIAKGLYRIYGNAFGPDPDSSMMTEMAQRFGEFHNTTNAGIVNFDAMEVQEMMYYYGDTAFTGEVYRHIDHPVHGSTSGPQLSWGYYEPMFHCVRDSKKSAGIPVPRGIPYAADMKIGLHQSHWSASSPYAYAWAIPANAAAGRNIDLTAQAGFHDVTMDMITRHGLVDHYATVFRQWTQWGFKLPAEIKQRIFASWRENGRYSLIDEIFRIEGEGETLAVVPFRMMKREGIDGSWTYH